MVMPAADLTGKLDLLFVQLKTLLDEGLIVAFSGGVDSTLLLWAAQKVQRESLGFASNFNDEAPAGGSSRLLAVTTRSASMPEVELREACELAAKLGVAHIVVQSHEVQQPQYQKNSGDRCYYCKQELFSISSSLAQERGIKNIAYGYTASDRGDHRPGHLAATQAKVHAPLDNVGLTKDEIRWLLRENVGISIAEKPASPCLASRVVTGVTVTEEKLHVIERLEGFWRERGLKGFRVRWHELPALNQSPKVLLRLEVDPIQWPCVLEHQRAFSDFASRNSVSFVTLDLKGYVQGGAN